MNKSIVNLRLIMLVALIGVGLAACTAATPQVAYYSLLDADIVKTTEKRNDPLILSVGPVNIPDVLKKSQIAIGGTDGRYLLSDYHRWAGAVDREFARALTEQLASKLGTEQVYIFPGEQNLDPTYQVLVDVLEMNGELGKEAKLNVRWTLINPKGKMATITRQSRFSEQLAAGGYDSWVRAQQHNISLLSGEIANLIKERTRP